jgi:translation initiation factor 3 subunit I
LFDIETLELLKTYTTERPVNSAAISPIKDHVILGGGQEAIEVFDYLFVFLLKIRI